MVSVKQIENFLVLARVLHFARAAQELGISQATLSGEIKKMERDLGFLLFDRSDKWAISLTAAGKSYYECIKNIPEDIAFARREAGKSARGENGSLTITANNIVYDYMDLGNICKRMSDKYPEVTLRVLDLPQTVYMFDYLRQGKADIGILVAGSDRQPPEGFVFKKLLTLQLMLALPKRSLLADKEKIGVDDLKNVNFVLPPREEAPNLRRAWDEYFMKYCQCLPLVVHEVLGYRGTLQFVAAGFGAGFVFQRRHNLFPEEVVLRELPVKMERSLILCCRENDHSMVLKNFLQLLPPPADLFDMGYKEAGY